MVLNMFHNIQRQISVSSLLGGVQGYWCKNKPSENPDFRKNLTEIHAIQRACAKLQGIVRDNPSDVRFQKKKDVTLYTAVYWRNDFR